jgi:energy-coupling factor transport system substrate-specific component
MRYGGSQAQPQWLLVGAGVALTVATYLFLIVARPAGLEQAVASNTSALIALAGYLLGAGLIIWGVSRQFTTSTYALIPIGIAVNIIVGQLVSILKLPLYLDSIGTVLVGVLAGPWAGAATGGLANIIWGLFNPIPLPFAIVAIAIGLLAGFWARIGWFNRIYLAPVAGAITGIVAALLSAPLSAFIFGGVTGAGSDALVAAFRAYGETILGATTRQGLAQDPLDKLISFTIVFFILVALPPRVRSRFSRSSPAAASLRR